MNPDLALYLVPLAAGLVAGFAAGRFTGKNAAHLRELQAKLEELRKEREQAAAELQAAKAEIERRQRELDAYQTKVSNHFAGTSEQFRDFSLQYRALFDHLARGASELCPEGFPALEGSPEAIPARTSPAGATPDGEASEARPPADPGAR